MQTVPLQALPNQLVAVQLGGQSCRLSIYQLASGLFCDVYVSNALIIAGIVCQNVNRIVRDAYLGFIGDLIFVDVTGAGADPDSSGLGSRWQLIYLEASDL